MEQTLSQAVEYATDTAISALAEAGCYKKKITEQEHELLNFQNQMGQVKSEVHFLRDKLARLEDQSRRDNLLFYGISEVRGETDLDCKRKIYNLLTTRLELPPHVVNNMRVVRCHRYGPYRAGRDRPIIIKMHWFADRQTHLVKERTVKRL